MTQTPDMRKKDAILANTSAGKDSQAMLDHLAKLADEQGVPRSKIIAVHANLGEAEWPGTLELARKQADAYGMRFEVVARPESLPRQIVTRRLTLNRQAHELGREAARLMAAGWTEFARQAIELGRQRKNTPAWPSSAARFCTSDQKTSQVAKLMTRLTAQHRAAGHTRPMRILNCLGIRAAESPTRAKKVPLGPDAASNGRRQVTRWLPIFGWSDAEVWATIHASGVPYHEAYDHGMPRLSCVLCVLAGHRELVLAARLNPQTARQYLHIEQFVGHTFQADLSMETIVSEARAAGPWRADETPTTIKEQTWTPCVCA